MFPQTSQNGPNCAKQVHTQQRRYHFHDDVIVKCCCLAWFLHEMTVTFFQIFHKPNFDLEPHYFFGMPMNRRFQWCIVYTETFSTFHAQVEYISFPKICYSNQCEQKITKTSPSPWGMRTPSNTPIPWPTPLITPNGIQIQSAVLPQYTFQTDWQTDRPTDGIDDKCVPRAFTLTVY